MNETLTSAKEPCYDKWQAESDMRTLTDAERIKKDPVRMKHARRAAKEKLAEMEGMKKLANGG